MVIDESEDSDSSHSSGDEERRIAQKALLQINQSAQQFEEGLETLVTLKRSNEQLEKTKASSMDESRSKISDGVLELNNWIGKLQSAERIPGDLNKAVKQTAEIKATTENLIESYAMQVKKYRDADEAERNRREQQRQWIDSSAGATISQLSKTALKAALLQIHLFALRFDERLQLLMGLKRDDEHLEDTMDRYMEESTTNFNNHVLELTNLIEKLQGTEAMLGALNEPVVKKAEIKATFERLIESFRRKAQTYKEAEEAEMKRRKQQKQRLDARVGAMITQLSIGAQKLDSEEKINV